MRKTNNETDNKIELGNGYWLFYDKYNYYVQKESISPKNGIKYMRRVSGYETKFVDAIDSCLEYRISESAVTTLKEMRKTVTEIKKDIKLWKANLRG